jgi:DNA-binding transcriptional MerR regulator
VDPVLPSWPQNLVDWRGTAAELAEKCNELLATVPTLAGDAGAANERLVRHYVQVGVLTPPEREGREAYFRARQVVEFLATRYLLRDGWPLAKAGEIVRGTDVTGLTQLIPSDRPRTRAEEVIAQFRGMTKSSAPASVGDPPAPSPRALRAGFSGVFSLGPEHDSGQSAEQRVMQLETPLARAFDISRRRVTLEENLKALGNRAGRPERSHIVRIELTPWCHVDVDATQLGEMSEDTPEILGAALTQALQEERINKRR